MAAAAMVKVATLTVEAKAIVMARAARESGAAFHTAYQNAAAMRKSKFLNALGFECSWPRQ
jgi:hypothetical protein